MSKKAMDLRAAMQSRANPATPVLRPSPTPRAVEPDEPRDLHYRPGREGKTNVTGYFPLEVKKQLRIIAAEWNTTIQDLLGEALNDLFAKHGKPEIAPKSEPF